MIRILNSFFLQIWGLCVNFQLSVIFHLFVSFLDDASTNAADQQPPRQDREQLRQRVSRSVRLSRLDSTEELQKQPTTW